VAVDDAVVETETVFGGVLSEDAETLAVVVDDCELELE